MCQYSKCSRFDPFIIRFWKVFRNKMNDKERIRFLKFVWGQTRLPKNIDDYPYKFKIVKMSCEGNPDDVCLHTTSCTHHTYPCLFCLQFLAAAHTCFFTLDVPPYTTEEVMYEKLLYSITHCVAMIQA